MVINVLEKGTIGRLFMWLKRGSFPWLLVWLKKEQFWVVIRVVKKRQICICNRMRPSRIKDKFSRVFVKFSQNCPSRVATRAICENFENTSENLPLILRGLNAITCL